jgi:hypothetical protein
VERFTSSEMGKKNVRYDTGGRCLTRVPALADVHYERRSLPNADDSTNEAYLALSLNSMDGGLPLPFSDGYIHGEFK